MTRDDRQTPAAGGSIRGDGFVACGSPTSRLQGYLGAGDRACRTHRPDFAGRSGWFSIPLVFAHGSNFSKTLLFTGYLPVLFALETAFICVQTVSPPASSQSLTCFSSQAKDSTCLRHIGMVMVPACGLGLWLQTAAFSQPASTTC